MYKTLISAIRWPRYGNLFGGIIVFCYSIIGGERLRRATAATNLPLKKASKRVKNSVFGQFLVEFSPFFLNLTQGPLTIVQDLHVGESNLPVGQGMADIRAMGWEPIIQFYLPLVLPTNL